MVTHRLLHGDCRTLMAAMEPDSVDSIVTDPPYGLSREPDAAEVLRHWLAGEDYHHRGGGFMGQSWDSFVPGPATWAEAYRVLKPGGYLVAFFGTRTYDLGAMAIRLAGFEIRDMLEWLYGSGFPKGGVRDGVGTCLKPAHEPIVMARKPLRGSARANIARYGTGGLNIDACRIATAGRPARVKVGGPDVAGATVFGSGLSPGSRAVEDTQLGRWPANVVHDGSDAVVAEFPVLGVSRGGSRGAGGQHGRYSAIAAQPDVAPGFGDSGSAARFFYCAKASKGDRDEGLDHFDPQAFVQFQTGNGESGHASSLSEGRATEYRNVHPTVKPEALMRWLVRLVTPPGGLVLDPFAGSGSTGKAAILEGRSFVGCELTDAYVPIARARIAAAAERAEAA